MLPATDKSDFDTTNLQIETNLPLKPKVPREHLFWTARTHKEVRTIRIQVMMTPVDVRLPKIIVTNKNRECPHTIRQGAQGSTGNPRITVLSPWGLAAARNRCCCTSQSHDTDTHIYIKSLVFYN